jgi:hypothetical protein
MANAERHILAENTRVSDKQPDKNYPYNEKRPYTHERPRRTTYQVGQSQDKSDGKSNF